MAGSLEAVRVFEAKYYGEMPEHVKNMARLRDEGFSQIQHPEEDEDRWHGIDKLGDSVCGLADVPIRYERELFASLFMRARGEFLLGERSYAADIALEAMDHVPQVPGEFSGVIADQYAAIASGRLSLILSTSNNGGFAKSEREDTDNRKAAVEAARLARRTCRHSEDRAKMLFANGEMTEAEREHTRKRYTIAAAAATVGLWLPQATTLSIAQKICA